MATIELVDKKVLVLGGSGVLGSRIAQELARRGARPVLAGRDASRLHARATEIGGDTHSVVFDMRQPEHAQHVIATTVELVGGLDGVVNAAGVVAFGNLAETDAAAIIEVVTTDLLGPLLVMSEALRHLNGGFLVNITGVVAEQPVAGMATYSAAKAGLSAASAALARELRRGGVHVLDARPPHTETGLAERPVAGETPRMPTGLDPAHVAEVIVDGLAAGARELPAAAFAAS